MTGNDTNQPQNNTIAPIQDGAVPFVPFSNSSPTNGSISVSASPESGPIKINTSESKSGSQEYGYDAIQLIEQKAEQEALAKETAEKKESKSPLPGKNPQDDNKKDDDKKQLPAQSVNQPVNDFPRFQGHKVSESITKDVETIKSEVGKGNPNKAQTAVYIFLDRLLKKQSANGK